MPPEFGRSLSKCMEFQVSCFKGGPLLDWKKHSIKIRIFHRDKVHRTIISTQRVNIYSRGTDDDTVRQ